MALRQERQPSETGGSSGPKRERGEIPGSFTIEPWTLSRAAEIYDVERDTWPPWLYKPYQIIRTIAGDEKKTKTNLLVSVRSPITSISARTEIPTQARRTITVASPLDGQFVDRVAGIVSATRTNWDGNLDTLKSWDDYAGGSLGTSSYPDYDPTGNTIVLMSSSVAHDFKGQGVVSRLFKELQQIEGVENIIGPFRPSGYGKYKLEHNVNSFADFQEYCRMVINKDLKDPWLNAVLHMGMEPLDFIENSMRVEIPIEAFEFYRERYKPHGEWVEINGKWECGETGSWTIERRKSDGTEYAVYEEPNLLGKFPIKRK